MSILTSLGLCAKSNIYVRSYPLILRNISASQDTVPEDTDSVNIVNLNQQIFKELIKNSNSDYHLVVFYAEWCKPCTEKMPIINSIASEFENLTSYYIYTDTEKNLKFLRKYLLSQSFITKTYVLDNTYKGNVKRRFKSFRDQICSECENNIGFPTVILLDKNMKVLYNETGDITKLRDILTELD